jgi:hypothetical protein
MAYIGIIPAITVTQQDAGDVAWQTVTLTDDTIFPIEFPDEDVAREFIVEIIDGDQYAVTWGDSNTYPIKWEGGTEPTLGPKSLVRFYYDGDGEIFGQILGADFEV